MTEQELRALVQDVVADRLRRDPAYVGRGFSPAGSAHTAADCRTHASHAMLSMAPAVERGQPCVIEPHVGCSQCGFCKSLGH